MGYFGPLPEFVVDKIALYWAVKLGTPYTGPIPTPRGGVPLSMLKFKYARKEVIPLLGLKKPCAGNNPPETLLEGPAPSN